jgi:transcriptional regulator NrdR family protein
MTERTKGLRCASCGGKLYTVDSRPHRVGIRRIRACQDCNERVLTVEVALTRGAAFVVWSDPDKAGAAGVEVRAATRAPTQWHVTADDTEPA